MANPTLLALIFYFVIHTTSMDPICKDTHVYCVSWASRGECKKNPSYMLVKCPNSCHQCCGDSDENCKSWATRGECEINPDYMLVQCRESCGICSKEGSVDSIPQTSTAAAIGENTATVAENPCIDDPTNLKYNCPALVEFYYL